MSDTKRPNGVVQWIAYQPLPIRVVIFFVLVVGIIAAMFYGVAAIYFFNVGALPRVASISLDETNYSVREFVVFEDEQAYIGALAADDDAGLLYMGSYATGAIWTAAPDGTIRELPQTRDQLQSVVGLAYREGVLTILDSNNPLANDGGSIWQWANDNLTQIATLSTTGSNPIAAPNDVAVDADGNIYVVDIAQERIWRFTAEGESNIWWRVPAEGDDPAPTGLAYSPSNNSVLVVDITTNAIYEIPVDAKDTQAAATEIFRYTREESFPGFNGIDVSESGEIYLAGLDQNRVSRLNQDTGELEYLAGAFRGSSDVVYDDVRERIFVNNWDQRWLRPVGFVFTSRMIDPRLPFSVDVIEPITE